MLVARIKRPPRNRLRRAAGGAPLGGDGLALQAENKPAWTAGVPGTRGGPGRRYPGGGNTMAGDAKKLQPIIIKKVKKGGHAVHGGAWKIAYADFVTAMMAFFLLMWLLGSTTEGDKKGMADYFASPLKVADGRWFGQGDSSHVVKGGGQDFTRTTGQVKRGEQSRPTRSTINLHRSRPNSAAPRWRGWKP
jgi:hypothetical protein